jgi:hypothetical protein
MGITAPHLTLTPSHNTRPVTTVICPAHAYLCLLRCLASSQGLHNDSQAARCALNCDAAVLQAKLLQQGWNTLPVATAQEKRACEQCTSTQHSYLP